MSISARLKEERVRLDMSQTALGELGGAGKSTVISWERGTAHPNAAFLAALASHGMDVLYVLTGKRSAASVEEEFLLTRYRQASPEVKQAALGALLGANSGMTQTMGGQVFHGPVHGIAGRDVVNVSSKGRRR